MSPGRSLLTSQKHNGSEVELEPLEPLREEGTHAHITRPRTTLLNGLLPHAYWRRSIVLAACLLMLVLVGNLILHGISFDWLLDGGGNVEVFAGNCNTSQTISTGWHVLINVFSTKLFAASNVGIQVLSAPTRKDIDAAHAKRVWLHVGER